MNYEDNDNNINYRINSSRISDLDLVEFWRLSSSSRQASILSLITSGLAISGDVRRDSMINSEICKKF